MSRMTAVMATLFFITSLVLTYLAANTGAPRSLMQSVPATPAAQIPVPGTPAQPGASAVPVPTVPAATGAAPEAGKGAAKSEDIPK
jgi:preprotein translocase subunit SecG